MNRTFERFLSRHLVGSVCVAIFLLFLILSLVLTTVELKPSQEYLEAKTITEEHFDSLQEILIFPHLSDIHINTHVEADPAIGRFENFVNNSLPYLDPTALIISGDLVDNIRNGFPGPLYDGATSYDDWQKYDRLISYIPSSIPVFDIMGNHGTFGYYEHSYRTQISRIGRLLQNETDIITANYHGMCFVALEALQIPGFLPPFNFLAHYSEDEGRRVEAALRRAKVDPSCQLTVLVSHFPLESLTRIRQHQIRDWGREGLFVYMLSGHLHRPLFNVIDEEKVCVAAFSYSYSFLF
eukprot:GCRY01003282.1.p1 GENE.GCRY01003282.1~~GCRY01003282.1.p1  ORF type:complete len:296 (-),score=49.64 GCRY01003282.1:188-1075(-)